MNASEMTNEILAENLEATIPFLTKEARHITDADEIMIEAAARLRNVTVHSDNSKVIDELQRRLKIAEDALDKIYKCIDNRYGVDASLLAKNIIADALIAIRNEGGAK